MPVLPDFKFVSFILDTQRFILGSHLPLSHSAATDIMNSLGKMIGSQKPVAPTVYDDDEVYPLHMLDLPKPVAGFMIRGLLFNDQLDANVLHNSLARLADIGDWRKIGGRVRTCVSWF